MISDDLLPFSWSMQGIGQSQLEVLNTDEFSSTPFSFVLLSNIKYKIFKCGSQRKIGVQDQLVAQPDDLSDIPIWFSMSIIQIQVTEKYSTAMCYYRSIGPTTTLCQIFLKLETSRLNHNVHLGAQVTFLLELFARDFERFISFLEIKNKYK